MSKRLTVKSQLTLSCALFVAVVAGLGVTCWHSQSGLSRLLARVIRSDAEKTNLSLTMTSLFQEMRAEARGAQISVMIGHFEGKQKDGQCSACHGRETVDQHHARFRELAGQVESRLHKMSGFALTAGEREEIAAARTQVRQWVAANEEYLKQTGGDDFEVAHAIAMEQISPAIGKAGEAASHLAKWQQQAMAAASEDADRQIARAV